MLLQTYSDINKQWENIKFYKINGDINLFYNKLSSKIIEVEIDDKKYIYQTSNGNEWNLQNIETDDNKSIQNTTKGKWWR
jgi:hypothetical protein